MQPSSGIDALRETKVKASTLEEGEVITVEVPLIGPEISAMIDNMLYLSCYGHKHIFEDRVPPASRLTFLALKIAREKCDDFFAYWKDYCTRHQMNNPQPEEADKKVTGLVSELMRNDEEGEAPAPAARHAAPCLVLLDRQCLGVALISNKSPIKNDCLYLHVSA